MNDSEKAVRDQLRHMKLKGCSAVTIDHRKKMLARLAAFLVDVPLLEATADMLYEWRASLDGKVKDATAAQYISHVKLFYAFCVERDILETDPAKDLPVPKVPRLLPRPIPTADLAYALDHAPRIIRLMYILAAYCGLRVKEIACLRAENVRLRDDNPVIIIASDGTKGHNERAVPMSPSVIAEFLLAGLPPASGPVFPAADGVSHLKPGMITKICRQHLIGCGIPSRAHNLRHWFATTGYAVDNDILAVQELLGHVRLETTANYAKLNKARTAALVNAMPPPDDLLKEGAALRKVMAREAS